MPYYSTRYINNQMVIRNGKHITRCWDSNGYYEVPTDPKSIRPKRESMLWKPGKDETSFSGRQLGKDGVYLGQNTKDDIQRF